MSEAHNATASIEFLKIVYPDGPWCLAAIPREGGNPVVRTFSPQTEVECQEWITARNGNANLYWHVNEVISQPTSKPNREGMAAVHFLHVDVDPGLTNDLKKEQDRILGMFLAEDLGGKPKKGIPLPTFVVFSGGGYQAFWKLSERLPINGDLVKAEDAKRYNQRLEKIYGADNCRKHPVSAAGGAVFRRPCRPRRSVRASSMAATRRADARDARRSVRGRRRAMLVDRWRSFSQ